MMVGASVCRGAPSARLQSMRQSMAASLPTRSIGKRSNKVEFGMEEPPYSVTILECRARLTLCDKALTPLLGGKSCKSRLAFAEAILGCTALPLIKIEQIGRESCRERV